MHPAINKIVSSTFYFNKLMTAPSTARARQHPLPACFVNVTGGHEEFQERSCFNKKEAEEVVSLALHCVEYLGFSQERINVLSFYNAQRDILERMLARAQLEDVAVLSVDSMQGREADVIILSCVRADVAGGLGFVADARRVNVALSRARESLVVCGSSVVAHPPPPTPTVPEPTLPYPPRYPNPPSPPCRSASRLSASGGEIE